MTTSARSVAWVAALLVVVSLTSCSSVVAGQSVPPLPPPPPTNVVVQVSVSSGGLLPLDYAMLSRPAVTIYGNGDAYVLADDGPRLGALGAPWALRRGSVSPATLVRLVAAVEASGLFAGADFGRPRIYDAGGVRVSFRPTSAPARTVAVGALDIPGVDAQLAPAQRASRAALRRLISAFRRSVTLPDTGDAGAWAPTRIDVTDSDPIDPDRVAPIAWPGPDPRATQPASAADPCVVVAGPTAVRLFRAARAHRSARWLVGGRVRTLIVRALLPGEQACER